MANLNPNVEKWLEALESGEYEQGRTYLHTKENGVEEYCCLGVACEVAQANGIELKVEVENGAFYYDGSSAFLPHVVQEWVRLAFSDGSPNDDYYSTLSSLTSMNDKGVPFREIAQYIRENYHKLATDEDA